MKRIAIFGGSFQPPGLHHRTIVEALSNAFDEVLVIPCGPRPDKPTTNALDPAFRATMVDLAFRQLPRVRVDLFDLEQDSFTRTIELEERYHHEGELWHIVGADLVRGGAEGRSEIQRSWFRGEELWDSARFGVLSRPGFEIPSVDLPPHHLTLSLDVPGASNDIRARLASGEEVSDLVPPSVAQYIAKWRLYAGTPRTLTCSTTFAAPRVEIIADANNKEAIRFAERFKSFVSPEPEMLVVIGGDGWMLRTIRGHWRRRLPFYGVNAGHVGYLLNSAEAPFGKGMSLPTRHLPLLYVEAAGAPRAQVATYAFNDAWVERASGQAAWIEIRIDGAVHTAKLVSDGALVASAAGSRSYARAMGAQPLAIASEDLLVAGSNVLFPAEWRHLTLPRDSLIELRSLNPLKRPLFGYVDGTKLGSVDGLKIRRSRTASVELLFQLDHPSHA